MNILVVCHYGLYQDLSSSFVHGQVKAYAKLGHRVRVVIPIGIGKTGPDGKRFGPMVICRQADGVDMFYMRHLSLSRYGKKCFNRFAACAAIRGAWNVILGNFLPDVIHAHTLGFDTEIGAWMKGRLDCPLIVTTHGSDASIPHEHGDMTFLRQQCNQADMVVAVSSALAEKVRAGGSDTPIRCILNGFNLKYVPNKIEKEPLSLIQVGNLFQQKRTHVTIDAFAKIYKANPDARLEIVGTGPEKESLQTQCESLGVSDVVRFAGQIPNVQVLEKMSKAQFFVMPSVREGFGIVYLEAMACGCIAIGTQDEGIADLIRHGENGFLVPPDNADAIVQVITYCLEYPEEARKIAETGRQAALQLTWEENARQYELLLGRVINGKSRNVSAEQIN